MTVTKDAVLAALARIRLPSGRDLVAEDLVRALLIEAESLISEAMKPQVVERSLAQRPSS